MGPFEQAKQDEIRRYINDVRKHEDRLIRLTGKSESELTVEEKAYLEQEFRDCDNDRTYSQQLLEEAQKVFDPYSDDGLVGAYESRLRILKLLGLPIPHEPLRP